MAATPCYTGPNPVTDKERLVIWKWAKEHGGVDKGNQIEQVARDINDHFFAGKAPQDWITDIVSGRKTPFRRVTNDLWRKQYNRRVIAQQAREARELATLGPVAKFLRGAWFLPRSVAVFGHGIVFPVTHAGDLMFRPLSWKQFVQGTIRAYTAAWVPSALGGGKAYAGRLLSRIEGDSLYDTALRSKLDVGAASHPQGLISRSYKGAAQRAWDALTVMRYELWKNEMGKYVKDHMTEEQINDIGTHLAEWANNATGSGSGKIAELGGGKKAILFGPRLTQSKLNRLASDPLTTMNTFQKMLRGAETTAGERAAAWTRLSGATQWLITNAGFLAVNQGVLMWAGSKEKINFTDPTRGDFMAMKLPGVYGYVPGMHTEVKLLARILAIAFAAKKPPDWYPNWLKELSTDWHKGLRGTPQMKAAFGSMGEYMGAKISPHYQRLISEPLFGHNFKGQPLPWSSDVGTPNLPRQHWLEYLADIGPIPLSGPLGYVYDKLQAQGMTKTESMSFIKALGYEGFNLLMQAKSDPMFYATLALGIPGTHLRAEHTKPEPPPTIQTPGQMKRDLFKQQGIKMPKTQKQLMKEYLKTH